MSTEGRLQVALKLLGYEHSHDPFDRSNLVLAVQFFAGVQKDDALETECELEIKNIRAEIAEKRRQQA